MIVVLGCLGLPANLAADGLDGVTPVVGQDGSSPANAVRMECGKPVGGSLPADGGAWTVFLATQGQTRGVSMWFGPLAPDTADLTFDRTPYFKIWVYSQATGMPVFTHIGAGASRGPYWNAKTWRGAKDPIRDHYVEVINTSLVNIDYMVTLDCRWPI